MNDELDELLGITEETVAEPESTETPASTETTEEVCYPTLKDWKDVGRSYAKEEGEIRWKIGDWLTAGIDQFGPKKAYNAARAVTGYATTTLYEFARVARRVPGGRSSVRTEDLSWNHHKAVEKLWEDPELQKDWLRQAQSVNLSVDALKTAIKRQGRPGYPRKSEVAVKEDDRIRDFRVRFTTAELKRVNRLAEIRNLAPGELIHKIVLSHFEDSQVIAEIEKADFVARETAIRRQKEGFRRFKDAVYRHLESICDELQLQDERRGGSGSFDPGEVARLWHQRTGKKLPRIALTMEPLLSRFGKMTLEDAQIGEYEDEIDENNLAELFD